MKADLFACREKAFNKRPSENKQPITAHRVGERGNYV